MKLEGKFAEAFGKDSLSYERKALGSSVGKDSACQKEDTGLILRSASSGRGNGNLLQYFCLETPWAEESVLQSMGSQRLIPIA